MDNWIPFEEGEYIINKAFIYSTAEKALMIENATLSIFTGSKGKRSMEGRGLVRNILLLELLEDSDELNLVMNFGSDLIYLLKEPRISGGKVFAADVRSSIRFFPKSPWEEIGVEVYKDMTDRLNFVSL